MLRTIGGLFSGAPEPIPLEVFTRGLRIVIKLNPDAFKVYADDLLFPFSQVQPIVKDELTNKSGSSARRYTLKNVRLETTQFIFNNEYHKSTLAKVRDGHFSQTFTEAIIQDTIWFKNWPTNTYQLNVNANKLTKIQMLIMSDIARYSP